MSSKFGRLFFYAILVLFIHCQSFSQTTLNTFQSPHYYLVLSESGNYTMSLFFSNMPTLGYESQHTISFGKYKRQGKFYVLDADKSIIDNQGVCADYSVQYASSLRRDSIIVFIKSPYEDDSDIVRIYMYQLTVHCSDGSIISTLDSINRIPIFLDSSQYISKIDIVVSYRPDFYSLANVYSFTHSPYCHISLDSIPFDSNMITLTMPNFKYFSLTYLPYRNYKVQIINKRTLLANGEIFHRFDSKYKMKLRRMNRKLQRHPIL